MVGNVGRPPKPKGLRVIKGGADSPPAKVVAPKTSLPDCPADLKGAAAAAWVYYGPEMAALRLIMKMDTGDFKAFCMNIAIRDEAWAELNKLGANGLLGLLIKTPNGYPIQSPYLAIFHKTNSEIRAYSDRFGLNPSARVRITGAAQMDLPFEDPFDAFLAESA